TNRLMGATAGQASDSNRFEPLMVGDHVATTGHMDVDALGNPFQSAHTMLVGVQIATAPGQADYITVLEGEWDVNTWANLRLKGLNIGAMSSDTNAGIYRNVVNGASDATLGGSCEKTQLIGHSEACNLLGGAGTCTANLAANAINATGNGQVLKLVYDWDFVVGESKAFRNPAAVLGAQGDPDGLMVVGDTQANNNFRIFTPAGRDVVYKTATFEACEAGTGPCFDVRDANGNPAQWGFYLSPLGLGHPEWEEISLQEFNHPFSFEGIAWAKDRRLGPGGGNEPLAAIPLHDPSMALDPFPTSGIDSCGVISNMLATANTGFVPTICTQEFLIRDVCAGAASAPAPTGDTSPPIVTPEADVILDSAGPFPVPVHLGSPTVIDNVSAPANITLANDNPSGNYDVGVTMVTWWAMDEAGNMGFNTQLVIVNNTNPITIDSNRPVITMLGNPVVNLFKNDPYVDAGATALDDVDGDITASIVTDNPVDMAFAGNYTVTYNVMDSSGNPAFEVTRTVIVDEDVTPPVITMLGLNPASVNEGGAYVDAGATVSDETDPAPSLTTATTVNNTVTYSAADASGNTAVAVRTVNVVGAPGDNTAPVITMLGNAVVNMTVGGAYTDAGATASDNVDGDITLSIVTVNPVNTALAGSYLVTYNVTDAANNPAVQVSRIVNVQAAPGDSTPPVITLTGAAVVNLTVDDAYNDAGATALDDVDGDITLSIVTVNPVNTALVGSYTVTYNVVDAAGNGAAQVSRTVNVNAAVDNIAPVITLLGNAEVNLTLGQPYTDAGATAADNVDGNITGNIVTVNPVDVNAALSYIVTYNVVDAAGNAAVQVSRIVNVVDPGPPTTEVCSLTRALYIGGAFRDFWSISGTSDTLQGQAVDVYLGPVGDTSRPIGATTVSSTGRISLTTPRGSASTDGTVPGINDTEAWIQTSLGCTASASVRQIGN
ncbi:MAG: immunoglobulin-like domain-containing protein, partial [Phycisphaerae bacterium]